MWARTVKKKRYLWPSCYNAHCTAKQTMLFHSIRKQDYYERVVSHFWKKFAPSPRHNRKTSRNLGWLSCFHLQCFGFTRGSREKGNTVPLKCCLLKTVYRASVINNLSQDSYFWSGLRGGNLLESDSFILRFTVLPFPAERGGKWNHMFWGASVGNPTEDKWLLLSPGN